MNRFLLTSLSILALSSTATIASAQDFSDAQRVEIKKMFDEYLATSGEAVLQSVNKYQADLESKDRAEAEVKAKTFIESLGDTKDMPMAGNPDGDITIVEFFDYNCGYCHKALTEIQSLLKDDKNVKVIFMEMPILGPSSLVAAQWSLAAQKQDKYFDYHQAIMGFDGPKDDASMEKLAGEVGLDVEKLKKDKDSAEIKKSIETKIQQAQDLGIRGTPGFIVAGQLFPGYIPAAQMKEIIAEARKK